MLYHKRSADGEKLFLWISVLGWGARSLVSKLTTMATGRVLGEVKRSLSGFAGQVHRR